MGDGVRKYSCDTDNILDFIMPLVCDHRLAVLKLVIFFFEWTNPYKIAQMFKKRKILMIFFSRIFNHRKSELSKHKINYQCQFLILKHPKPKGRILRTLLP